MGKKKLKQEINQLRKEIDLLCSNDVIGIALYRTIRSLKKDIDEKVMKGTGVDTGNLKCNISKLVN